MSYGKAPIDVRRPKTQDNKVYLSTDVYPMLRWGSVGEFLYWC